MPGFVDPRTIPQHEALEKVRTFLQERAPEGTHVTIGTWNLPAAGLRVAEVDYVKGRAGVCFMQSDPGGLQVCAAVERAVLDLVHFPRDVEDSLAVLADLTKVEGA